MRKILVLIGLLLPVSANAESLLSPNPKDAGATISALSNETIVMSDGRSYICGEGGSDNLRAVYASNDQCGSFDCGEGQVRCCEDRAGFLTDDKWSNCKASKLVAVAPVSQPTGNEMASAPALVETQKKIDNCVSSVKPISLATIRIARPGVLWCTEDKAQVAASARVFSLGVNDEYWLYDNDVVVKDACAKNPNGLSDAAFANEIKSKLKKVVICKDGWLNNQITLVDVDKLTNDCVAGVKSNTKTLAAVSAGEPNGLCDPDNKKLTNDALILEIDGSRFIFAENTVRKICRDKASVNDKNNDMGMEEYLANVVSELANELPMAYSCDPEPAPADETLAGDPLSACYNWFTANAKTAMGFANGVCAASNGEAVKGLFDVIQMPTYTKTYKYSAPDKEGFCKVMAERGETSYETVFVDYMLTNYPNVIEIKNCEKTTPAATCPEGQYTNSVSKACEPCAGIANATATCGCNTGFTATFGTDGKLICAVPAPVVPGICPVAGTYMNNVSKVCESCAAVAGANTVNCDCQPTYIKGFDGATGILTCTAPAPVAKLEFKPIGVDLTERSRWTSADGSFNTARLASDGIAGAVLGTAGGVVTNILVSKSQKETGFENVRCTAGGKEVGGWDDEISLSINGML
jgi:hypothetical protein